MNITSVFEKMQESLKLKYPEKCVMIIFDSIYSNKELFSLKSVCMHIERKVNYYQDFF